MTKIPEKDSAWNQYFQVTKNRPPHPTLLRALKSLEQEGLPEENKEAVDLGCGAGRDTAELLRRNWKVLAIDHDQDALDAVSQRMADQFPGGEKADIRLQLETFSQLTLGPRSVFLLNASYSLPFCPPESFASLWGQITGALRSGGRFSGQLFGLNDTWATRPEMSFHSKRDVQDLFCGFQLEHLEERQEDKPTALGVMKHWHVFDLVAKKL